MTPAAAKLTHIPEILEEHFEELEFLWGQRESALESPDTTVRSFLLLEGRIRAHQDALVEAGDRAVPLLERGLGEKSRSVVFAAAIVALLQGSHAWADRLFAGFGEATGGKLEGLAAAFSHGPDGLVVDRLRGALERAPAPAAAAAARALARHGRLPAGDRRLHELLASGEPAVRLGAWRAAALIPPPPPRGRELPEALYRDGASDPDDAIRAAALEAASWIREPWLLAHCRLAAAKPGEKSREEIRLLAILGDEADSEAILAAGRESSLGPWRFRALASYGHPRVVPPILEAMRAPDPVVAASAGAAFARLTGVDVASSERVAVSPPDGEKPDAFEEEFQDEVRLPDPAKADRAWSRLHDSMAKGTRWCVGFDVSGGLPDEARPRIDMASRREIALRAAFRGEPGASARDLEAFPQRAG